MGAATEYFAYRNSGTRMVLVVVMIVVMLQISDHLQVQAQGANCSAGTISDLNVCAPFVVPGATNTNPSADCCATLQSIDNDCYCNTLRFAAQIPTHCNFPPLSCSVN